MPKMQQGVRFKYNNEINSVNMHHSYRILLFWCNVVYEISVSNILVQLTPQFEQECAAYIAILYKIVHHRGTWERYVGKSVIDL